MNTLIAYGTKRGFTKKCAEILETKLQGTLTLKNLKDSKKLDLSKYDNIMIGSPVYIGKIRKEVADFCENNKNILLSKNLGLFICGMAEDDDLEDELKSCFPEELSKKALAVEFFGGEFNFDKMNFIEKTIIKKVSNTTENQEMLLTDNIQKFAEIFNS
jgi:menaquinone-dependent protoporphyrinogen oxidase